MLEPHRPGLAPTPGQIAALAAYVQVGGSVVEAADLVGIRPSTLKRHLADLRARTGLATVELIYSGRAAGWLSVPDLEPALKPLPAEPRLGPTASGAVGD